ncbi:hypothetical protein H0H93_010042 [Arthromyces matolae]|nr:hypothetical protein H0H93_010042 [Arthromyces matolae]
MPWFLQRDMFGFDYLPIAMRSEDDIHSQLSLESEDLLVDELVSSQEHSQQMNLQHPVSDYERPHEADEWMPEHSKTGGQRKPKKGQDHRLQLDNDCSAHFVPLARDTAAQNLLESMRQDSERIRGKRVQQRQTETTSADIRRLKHELEDLKRENEIYRSLASHPLSTSHPDSKEMEAQLLQEEVTHLKRTNEKLQSQLFETSSYPPEYAPPPYSR